MLRMPVRERETGVWARFGWIMPLMWLVFLVFPVMALLRSQAALGWIVIGWLSVVVFAAAYSWGSVLATSTRGWQPGTRFQWGMFAVMLLAMVLAAPAIYTSTLNFVPFVIAYGVFTLRGRAQWFISGGCVALVAVVLTVTDDWASSGTLVLVVALMAAGCTLIAHLISTSMREQERQQTEALIDQRLEFGRDVHDLLGHSLTVIKMKAELASKLVERDPARAQSELEQIVALAAEAIDGVRGTVSGLRGKDLSDQLAESGDALRSAGVALTVEGDEAALSPAQAVTATWVLREATTNIIRHARATAAWVRLAPGTISIADDGVGVSAEAGNGIGGMAERAHAAGAVLNIALRPGGGTTVEVTW